jgi:hypothetical protein
VEEETFMGNQVLHYCQKAKIKNVKSQSRIRTITFVLPNKQLSMKQQLSSW